MTRPRDLRAGFHADLHDDRSGLRHVGEQWAAPRYLITPHTHPVWEFYLQMHGRTHWTVGPAGITVPPGDLVGVPAGVTHHLAERPGGNHHFYFAAVDVPIALARRPELIAAWPQPAALIHRPGDRSLFVAFDHLVSEITARSEFSAVGLNVAVDLLVLQISRLLGPSAAGRISTMHPAIAHVRDLLERDYARDWSLADLAQSVGLARTYLAGLFTTEVGCSPRAFLLQRRVQRAEQLLLTSNLSITAIAAEVGFGSSQHFARVFRQHTGRAPRDLRARH